MPELARSRADGVIDRSKTRGIPLDPSAAEGRSSDWNLCRGNHLGQRSCASATTGRTYGRKRSDQSTAQHPCEERAVHIWIKEGKGAIKWTRLSCRTFAANAVRLQLHANSLVDHERRGRGLSITRVDHCSNADSHLSGRPLAMWKKLSAVPMWPWRRQSPFLASSRARRSERISIG
jgi:hypothetical protein